MKIARKILANLRRWWNVVAVVLAMILLTVVSPQLSKLELTIIGGGLYLLNKIFLDCMERRRRLTSAEPFWFWRKWAWGVYLMGLPPMVTILIREDNWIFVAIEVGGAPAMLYGFVTTLNRKDPPRWLDWLASISVLAGLGLSLWNLGGMSRPVTQGLELAGSAGFLIGTILLARDNQRGYSWFLLMNAATGILLYLQGYPWLALQQAISVAFILDARRIKKQQ